MMEIIIHDEDKSMICSPNTEKKMTCDVYNSPYLTTKKMRKLDPEDKYEISEINGSDKSVMFAGKEIILRNLK